MKTRANSEELVTSGGEAAAVSPLVALEDLSWVTSPRGIDSRQPGDYPGNLVGFAGLDGPGKTTLFRLCSVYCLRWRTLAHNCPLGNSGYVPKARLSIRSSP